MKIYSVFLILNLFGCQKCQTERLGESPSEASTDDDIRILFLGDSLTEGYEVDPSESYPSLVESLFYKEGFTNVRSINAGISGATTAGAVEKMDWHFRPEALPDLLVLALGANDGLRGIDLESSRSHLEAVIQKAQSQNIPVVLAGMKIPPNYGEDYTKRFEEMFVDLEKEYNLVRIPFLLEGVAANRDFNLADGIHPNPEGYKIVANLVYSYLSPLVKKIQEQKKGSQ